MERFFLTFLFLCSLVLPAGAQGCMGGIAEDGTLTLHYSRSRELAGADTVEVRLFKEGSPASDVRHAVTDTCVSIVYSLQLFGAGEYAIVIDDRQNAYTAHFTYHPSTCSWLSFRKENTFSTTASNE